jgi:hypothetical protein|tara:strand:+ start:40 stop:246 length:207 start_codon:yes stop_codon:yes gene_type:complete
MKIHQKEKGQKMPKPNKEKKERFKVSTMLHGPKRLENESYEDFKERQRVENILVKEYLKGTFIDGTEL